VKLDFQLKVSVELNLVVQDNGQLMLVGINGSETRVGWISGENAWTTLRERIAAKWGDHVQQVGSQVAEEIVAHLKLQFEARPQNLVHNKGWVFMRRIKRTSKRRVEDE
jgi:hypothetical protein